MLPASQLRSCVYFSAFDFFFAMPICPILSEVPEAKLHGFISITGAP